MIVAAKVQHTMHEQPLHFDYDRSVVVARLAARGLYRYHNISKRLARLRSVADVERQHVGRAIFAAKRSIKTLYFTVARQHNRDFASHPWRRFRQRGRHRTAQRQKRQLPAAGTAHDNARCVTRRHDRMP